MCEYDGRCLDYGWTAAQKREAENKALRRVPRSYRDPWHCTQMSHECLVQAFQFDRVRPSSDGEYDGAA